MQPAIEAVNQAREGHRPSYVAGLSGAPMDATIGVLGPKPAEGDHGFDGGREPRLGKMRLTPRR